MCEHCGCTLTGHTHTHEDGHTHSHNHSHESPPTAGRQVDVLQSLLSENERLAERNRGMFLAHRVVALNLMSSPGSGKTALIEQTLEATSGKTRRMGVIVGDLATENDARRIRDKGAPAQQITTGTVCHLDAHMVHHALEKMHLDALDYLLIENVGNLVCPASFDLGEQARVVLISVTEGEDKPLKYPVMFQRADLVIVNKIDIAEAVGYDRDEALENIRRAAPGAEIIELSAHTGQGVDLWFDWLDRQRAPFLLERP